MQRDPRELAGAWTRFQRHDFPAPAPDLAPFVSGYWSVSWDYDVPYRQKIAPYPQVHVTVRPGAGPEVHGVSRRHVVRVLEGAGRVVGAAFRPGAFRGFLDGPVSALTDRTVPAVTVPGLPGRPSEPVDVASLEGWLRSVLPGPEPSAAGREAGEVVSLAASDPSIGRVDQLAAAAGSSVRRLQRLFAEHVGVGPKWVIRRYRLHEVTERMAAGDPVDWAALAADLGYTDQPHLVRDVTGLFGEPPTHYARRYPAR
ncbi:helix-turn-helix domain-containing protein [Pseudonocardia sp. KRD291]|uniref:AraC family transcriptional regulator n=1 Tax=Pseudonocardia sp. KRD291 TaxID=2792007 RepID=UPI001C4A3287|nr:helix-turn-helix domain-containing protein [Pseudonocardia sp. KRD291]MBW0104730.1 AraC family transcriptional regulator [Pseudonocardia sp. KRD291]